MGLFFSCFQKEGPFHDKQREREETFKWKRESDTYIDEYFVVRKYNKFTWRENVLNRKLHSNTTSEIIIHFKKQVYAPD